MTDLLPWNVSKFSSNIVTILSENVALIYYVF
jgi:hypothetical protein